jgi:hypothetical protein
MYTIQSQSLPPSDSYRSGITVFFTISTSMGVTAVLGDERDVWDGDETLGVCEKYRGGGGGGGGGHGRRRLGHGEGGHPDGPWFTPSREEANTEHAASVSMLEGLDLSMCSKLAGSKGGTSFTNGCDEDIGTYQGSKSSERCEHFDELGLAASLRSYCGVPAVLAATVAFLLALYEMLVLKTGGSVPLDAHNPSGPVVVCGPGSNWGSCPNPSSGLSVWRPHNLRRALATATGAAGVLQIASVIVTSDSFTLPPEHVFGPGDALIGLQDLLAGCDLEDHIKKSSVYFVWANRFHADCGGGHQLEDPVAPGDQEQNLCRAPS